MKSKAADILQELESDDEFPEVYNDLPIMPAYQDDNRFAKLNFPWLKKYNQRPKEPEKKEEQIAVSYRKGVLTRQDLYCLKSIEPYISSSTLIWFVNFLLHKDYQSKYTFLKSCLVSDYVSTTQFSKKKYSQTKETNLNKTFEIIIKM